MVKDNICSLQIIMLWKKGKFGGCDLFKSNFSPQDHHLLCNVRIHWQGCSSVSGVFQVTWTMLILNWLCNALQCTPTELIHQGHSNSVTCLAQSCYVSVYSHCWGPHLERSLDAHLQKQWASLGVKFFRKQQRRQRRQKMKSWPRLRFLNLLASDISSSDSKIWLLKSDFWKQIYRFYRTLCVLVLNFKKCCSPRQQRVRV